MGIGDRIRTDLESSLAGVDQRIGRDLAQFKRQRHRERLHRRAGLETIHQNLVVHVALIEGAPIIGVERRPVGHRQNFTGINIEHDGAGGLGLVLLNRFLQRGKGLILQPTVDGQPYIGTSNRRPHFADGADTAAHPVERNLPKAFLTGQQLVPTARALANLATQVTHTHLEQTGQCLDLLAIGLGEHHRIDRDAAGRQARRQHDAVAIENLAARGFGRDGLAGAAQPGFAHFVGLAEMRIDGAGGQRAERHRHNECQRAQAPGGQTQAQQRLVDGN